MNGKRLALLASAALITLLLPAQAATFTVDSTGDASDAKPGSGVCGTLPGAMRTDPDRGPCTLRAAIQEANAFAGTDTIQFNIPLSDSNCTNGVCTIPVPTALPDLSADTTITGPGADKLVVHATADGNNPFRVFNVTVASTVTMTGLTISGGALPGNGSGAGIQNANSATVNINSCVVTGNFAINGGGGIFNNAGMVNISRSTFKSNSTTGGGAAIANSSGSVNAIDSTFIANMTVSGGGRGAISNATGGTTITNCTFSGNSSSEGGALAGNGSGVVTVINSTFNGNSSTLGGGGAIALFSGTINVNNCTITGNTAVNSPNGGAGGISKPGTGTINVTSTIIASNSATGFNTTQDVSGAFSSHGFNLVGKTNGSTGFTAATDRTGTDASPLDAKLDPNGLQDNGGPTKTIALLANSPAIDNGTRAALPVDLFTDQRGAGFARTVDDQKIPNPAGGDGTDIGAFEVQTVGSVLGNISTRVRVLTGDNALIGGMIATGTAPKKVIIRALGPTLTDLGLPGALSDPTLELFQGNSPVGVNDDWKNGSQQLEIANSGFAPNKDAESAIIATLTPNQNYTAIVRGKNGETGIGVVEAFDLDQAAPSKLANISTRGFVDVDDKVMIAGLIVIPANGGSVKVLVRALGPTLGDFGVPGSLADPTLDLVSSNGTVIRSNNNWKTSQQTEIEAAQLGPAHEEEAALVEFLPPAAYTAIVRGNNRTTGVGLVEVYNIQ
jgi:CSLREA domain-containing protein